jgi:hypothetical protein
LSTRSPKISGDPAKTSATSARHGSVEKSPSLILSTRTRVNVYVDFDQFSAKKNANFLGNKCYNGFLNKMSQNRKCVDYVSLNTDKCCDGFIADFDQFSAKKCQLS